MTPTGTAAGLARRRAITILAAFAGMPLLRRDRSSSDPEALYRWNGTSLGSQLAAWQ